LDRGEAHVRLADVTPADVKVAQLYGAFSPLIILSLGGLRLLRADEGGPFTDNENIEWPNGQLPVNTAGRHEQAYVHSFNLILEGVRQIRGTSTAQVDGADVSLVTSGEGVPTPRSSSRAGVVTMKRPGCSPTSMSRTPQASGKARPAVSCSCRRAAPCGVAHAAAADVPALPLARPHVGAHLRTSACGRSSCPPAAVACVRGVRPYKRDRRRARRGPDDPVTRGQPRHGSLAEAIKREIDPATIAIGEPVRCRLPADRRRGTSPQLGNARKQRSPASKRSRPARRHCQPGPALGAHRPRPFQPGPSSGSLTGRAGDMSGGEEGRN
jgi:hypothetical protein